MENVTLVSETYTKSVSGIDENMLNSKDDWYDYVDNLPLYQRVTYTTVIFHEQVFNGGFHQYFFNSYGQFGYLTVDSLRLIGAIKSKNLLESVLCLVNPKNMNIESFRHQVFFRKLEQIVNFDEELGNELNYYDMRYYNQEEDVMELLSNYLSKMGNRYI